ncbi:hypothetical protein PCURB6_16380 [Paenibacillus curdlanolyticus]|nr:hypothetical protein PCURB6_16380 [Paenibacillus curdlanolyticus]
MFSMFQIALFNDYPIVYQVMYVNLALSTIYLDGIFILFTGMFTTALTAFGFMFWKDTFFPQVDIHVANIPIILVIQTTMVLWGAAKIGAHLKNTINENEQQLLLINERNQALKQYADQVEKLTIVEERNRISREMHDTIGYTLTSIITGLEKMKVSLPDQASIDSLLLTARTGLDDIRDHIHMSDRIDDQLPFLTTLHNLIEQFSKNTDVKIDWAAFGEQYEVPAKYGLIFLRTTQEALTNAVRHGLATHIRISLNYDPNQITLRIEDNGRGTDELIYGFGLKSMQARVQSLQGSLHITSSLGKGLAVELCVPVRQEAASRSIRVLIVDDQTLIAESFAILLELEESIEVIGVLQDGQAALQFCEQDQPDLILMDLHMPVMDGIEATRRIKESWPHIKIIVLTTFQNVSWAAKAISYGAEGYLQKSIPPKHLADTIRMIANGGTLIPADIAKQMIEYRDTMSNEEEAEGPVKQAEAEPHSQHEWLDSLNEKELEILQCLSKGLTYKEIAAHMHYSEGTVKNYVSVVYSKLNVKNRMQAVNKYQSI